jgi:catechol 2,3-dioxygenase-like lactoylglutathione lyase family enzyme
MAEQIPPILDQVNVISGDMAASTAFYRALGLAIGDGDPAWDAHHRSVDAGGAGAAIDLDFDSLAFAGVWNEGLPPTGPRLLLGFRVESREAVDELYAELVAAGHPGQQPPYDAFWGARYAVVEDPDGHSVGLMSPVDPDRRTRPPDPPG